MFVLKKSTELISYKHGNTEMVYFNVIAADHNEILYIRCYQRYNFSKIRVGMTYKFSNMIKKGETCWIVSSSTIAFAAPIKPATFAEHRMILPEEESPAGSKRTLNDALESPQKSTVVGKIVQVSPLTFRREGTLTVRSLILKNETTVAKVVLFDKNATNAYVEDNVLEVTGLYQKVYQNKKQLTASTTTDYQYIPPDSLKSVTVEDADKQLFKHDDDFNVNDETTNKQELLLETIYEAVMYDCCTNPSCRKKKISDKYSICNGTERTKTYRIKVSVKANDENKTFTIFERDATTLFGEINYDNDDDLVMQLVMKLPIAFLGKISRNNLYDIQQKEEN